MNDLIDYLGGLSEQELERALLKIDDKKLDAIGGFIREEHYEGAERSLFGFIVRAWHWVETAKFVPGWHIKEICDHLEAMVRREIRTLLINIPPRHSKSLICNVFLPAWVWAMQPKEGTWLGPQTDFIFVTYSQALSLRDSVKARMLINSNWYQRRWPVKFQSDQGRMGRYTTSEGGTRLTLSTGGGITGDGADIIVVDDPHSATEAVSDVERNSTILWHDAALSTRENDPKTACRLYIQQRLHEEDLCGHLLEQGLADSHLCFPARYELEHPHPSFSPIREKPDPRKEEGELLWPNRFGEEELRRLEKALGPYGASGQLQQRPAPAEGGIMKPDRITLVEDLPKENIEFQVRGWDFAATDDVEKMDSAYTVGVKMVKYSNNPNVYIHNVSRFRAGPEQVKKMFLQTCKADGVDCLQDIPQDPGAAGKYVVRDLLKAARGFPVRYSPESGDKVLRAMPFASDMDDGLIYALLGDWWDAYRDELLLFPVGRFADQVDASSRAYQRIMEKTADSEVLAPPARQDKSYEDSLRKGDVWDDAKPKKKEEMSEEEEAASTRGSVGVGGL